MIARTNEGKIDYKKIIIESGLYLVLFCMGYQCVGGFVGVRQSCAC